MCSCLVELFECFSVSVFSQKNNIICVVEVCIEVFADSLREALQEFNFTAVQLGLQLSWQKTKIQNLGCSDPAIDMVVAGNTVEGVEEF